MKSRINERHWTSQVLGKPLQRVGNGNQCSCARWWNAVFKCKPPCWPLPCYRVKVRCVLCQLLSQPSCLAPCLTDNACVFQPLLPTCWCNLSVWLPSTLSLYISVFLYSIHLFLPNASHFIAISFHNSLSLCRNLSNCLSHLLYSLSPTHHVYYSFFLS